MSPSAARGIVPPSSSCEQGSDRDAMPWEPLPVPGQEAALQRAAPALPPSPRVHLGQTRAYSFPSWQEAGRGVRSGCSWKEGQAGFRGKMKINGGLPSAWPRWLGKQKEIGRGPADSS